MDAEIDTRFVETMRSWLISLPHDLKVLYEAAADENLERSTRELMVGAIIYVISPNDFISTDRDEFAGYADDCIMLRLALRSVAESDDEDVEFFRSRFPEFFDALGQEMEVCQAAMGAELYDWLGSRLAELKNLEYKGKKVSQYLDDDEASELLYEDGLGFRTEYPVEEELLADKFKKSSTILEVISRRKVEEDRKAVKA